jgi:hypothetical protein
MVIEYGDIVADNSPGKRKKCSQGQKRNESEKPRRVIKKLLTERKKISCSMFGSNRKLTSFKEEERAEFHEL